MQPSPGWRSRSAAPPFSLLASASSPSSGATARMPVRGRLTTLPCYYLPCSLSKVCVAVEIFTVPDLRLSCMHVHIIVMHVCDGPTEPPPSLVPVPLCCGFVDHFVSSHRAGDGQRRRGHRGQATPLAVSAQPGPRRVVAYDIAGDLVAGDDASPRHDRRHCGPVHIPTTTNHK